MVKLKSLLEEPDTLYHNGRAATWMDDDARAFGWYRGKLYYVDQPSYSHFDIGEDFLSRLTTLKSGQDWRDIQTWPGRLWLKKKVISFWKRPSTSGLMKVALKALQKTVRKDLSDFDVEIGKNKFKRVSQIMAGEKF